MLTAVQSLRLFAGGMAPWFRNETRRRLSRATNSGQPIKARSRQALDCCEHRSFLDPDSSSWLATTRSRAPRSGKSGDAHRSPKPSALCCETGPVIPERNAPMNERHDESRRAPTKHEAARLPVGNLTSGEAGGLRRRLCPSEQRSWRCRNSGILHWKRL